MSTTLFKSEKIIFFKFVFSLGLLSIILLKCSEFNKPGLTLPGVSNFEADDQGWRISENSENTVPEYSASGGNPDGYIYTTDRLSNAWYFIASTRFANEVKKGYGKTLYFDLKQSATDAQYDADDVILTDGTIVLTFNTAYNPSTTWTHYSIKLDELSGWKKGAQEATRTDIQAVLQNLTELKIRGEFRAGADTGGLDNAIIE
ncbi:hypothetical protein BH09BAC4_BH09BAC4_20860 [soil metagenome]